jgi:hypothetical protein
MQSNHPKLTISVKSKNSLLKGINHGYHTGREGVSVRVRSFVFPMNSNERTEQREYQIIYIYISMSRYRYILEKYRGLSTRYTCPQCGRKYTFTRYIDTENNIYIIISVIM